jgi:hypothetical protein
MKKLLRILNIVLIIGFILIVVDPRYYGQLDTVSFLDLFKDLSFWVIVVYFFITEYLVFSLINQVKVSRPKIVLLFVMLLPYLAVPYFYIQELLYIHSEFSTNGGGIFPMTMFTHVGSIISLVVIPFNLIYLISIYFKKND